MAKCSICGVEHDRVRGVGDDRPQSYCAGCHAAWMRVNRWPHRSLSPEAKMKANCRSYANVYKRRGKLIQQPCENCGSANSQMHHDDYTKPLQVRWMCRECHGDHHFFAHEYSSTQTNPAVPAPPATDAPPLIQQPPAPPAPLPVATAPAF